MVDAGGSVYEPNRANMVTSIPITITAHAANLQVVAATAPTSYACTNIVVQWVVTNAGDLPASSSYWVDAIYLTPDGIITASTPTLGYGYHLTGLSPGATYTNSVAVSLPANASGDYFLVVAADAFNFVPQPAGRSPFVITPPIHVTSCPTPDLAVTQLISPTNGFEGQPISLTWTVTNAGTVTAYGPWVDAAYLSLDQLLDPGADDISGLC